MMLWSIREIVRTFRSSKQAFSKLGCEEKIVKSNIPPVNSQMLNKRSNTDQYRDTFYHSYTDCADVPKSISTGLVKNSWYLSCGIRKIDKFSEPLAVANLRGDIKAYNTQHHHSSVRHLQLCTSSAMSQKTFTLKMLTMFQDNRCDPEEKD